MVRSLRIGGGRPDEALREAKRAWKLDPITPRTCMAPGVVYSMQRQYGRAIQAHQSVLELNPNFPLVNIHLATAYAAEGKCAGHWTATMDAPGGPAFTFL